MDGIKINLATKIIIRSLFLLWSLVVIYPMFWTLQSSLKSNKDLFQNIWGFPAVYKFANYTNAWVKGHIGDYFFNSVYVTCVAMACSVLIITMAAYAIGRSGGKISRVLTVYFIVVMMIPGSIAIIPQYLIIFDLGLINNLNGLVLKYTADSLPFGIFVLTGFYKSVPKEMEEAAHIDGCGYIRTYWNIMLPLVKPGVYTICIFNFLGFWNEYFFALITMSDPAKYTISVGVFCLQRGLGASVCRIRHCNGSFDSRICFFSKEHYKRFDYRRFKGLAICLYKEGRGRFKWN